MYRSLRSYNQKTQSGLTMIETVLGIALFVMVSSALFATYQRALTVITISKERISEIAVVNELLEIARNLPYSSVGTNGGIPSGVLVPVQTIVRAGKTYIATTTVRNIDNAFDGLAGGTPNDLAPADNKLVNVEVMCISCRSARSMEMSTIVAPKNLEGNSVNGSLFVRVFDSGGLPVQGANVNVRNVGIASPIDVDDVTATSGVLQLIDAPPGNTNYEVTVTKAGYSTDRSYGAPTTTNPVLPHATVIAQTVTQISLSIDRTSTLNFSSVSPLCSAVANVGTQMTGTKIISTSPDVPKFSRYFTTGASGTYTLNDVEFDQYPFTASSTAYDLAGVMPLSPVSVIPGSTQNVQLIMVPKLPPTLVVTVKDGGTGLPISGASVQLTLGSATTTKTTGRGYLSQTDWTGGSGQSDFTNATRYNFDDTNIDTTTVPGSVTLKNILGLYPASGTLESSTFDTGAASNFYQFTYQPSGQPPATGDSVRFQVASGNSTSSWTYLGPDGTAATYYNSTTTDISTANDNHRYFRYKMFLSTASSTLTPTVSDIQFTFTSSCTPPGQVIYQTLANGVYGLTVTKSGYTDYVGTVTVAGGAPLWQEKQVSLTP